VAGLDRRLREAARLGFDRAIVPVARGRDAPADHGVGSPDALSIVEVSTLREAVASALGDANHVRPERHPAVLG
jgi:predicted ATP-dependent serine protease